MISFCVFVLLLQFLPEPSVMGYPLSDFIGLNKWSDQPFTCDDENRREFDECKSLPIVAYANYAFAGAPQQHEDEEVRVTLMNHSKDSHFATVKKSTRAYNRQKGYKAATAGGAAAAAAAAAESTENLLTSDRTHFRPIKQTFVDGFIFDIPCTPDNIRYERTGTGSMYFDSERYMEYLGCEDADEVDGMQKGNFRLKFCVRQIEKYSQTEDRLLYLSGRMFTEPETVVRDDSDVDMTPDIFSYDNDGDDLDLFRQSTYTGSYQGTDCYGSECLDIDNWTMAEMKKNCVENNNSHTLWGHCAACNNSTMSLPANRLLRDELYADGEEILSDLRDMQDLYIGEDGDESEWENEVFAEDAAQGNAKEMYYYNVNKLISDLLRPETVKQLTQVLGEKNQKTIMEGIMADEAPVWQARAWSEWKENEVMARDEISYNISDEHLRCLMREKRRPDRKRRHSASQNLPEDISMGYRNKFHGNAMLRDAWDAYEQHEALIELPSKSALNSSSILSRVTVTSRPLTR